jgi:hypothetical protein
MSRALALVACLAIAGCTASGDLMKTATPTVPLQFESEPPGAEVRTSGGQTCRTPCALAVPAADFQATYNLNGYQPQTIPVKLMPPDDMRGSEEFTAITTPRFDPSPVVAELVKAAPKKRPAKKARVAKKQQAPAATEPVEPGDGGFAPPAPSTSGFNPPPASGGFTPPPAQGQTAPGNSWPAPR